MHNTKRKNMIKGKHKDLHVHLGKNNLMHQYVLVADWLESSFPEKAIRI